MCGIFGIISNKKVIRYQLDTLVSNARQRGRDSSGIAFFKEQNYQIYKEDNDIKKLLLKHKNIESDLILGHSRLITNGLLDNQPVIRDDIFVLHNGIIVNENDLWNSIDVHRKYFIDSEVILGLAIQYLKINKTIVGLSEYIFHNCKGTISCCIVFSKLGKLVLLSNNGSLYTAEKNDTKYFSSESYPLRKLSLNNIKQSINEEIILDIPKSKKIITSNFSTRKENLIPALQKESAEEKLLKYPKFNHKRCTKCILPETMPFIEFDNKGVCNYCRNYSIRNNPKPFVEFQELVEPYRRIEGPECIVPFSGGRDSCYGLYLIVKELGLRPITYTYDWGMVNDLGRRNISLMCSELGVENIIVAADISQKRKNIAKNLQAWLKSPNLGMISILTAGDKHFYKHIEKIKYQTGVQLNLWGYNPLEVTHFKAGFLGVKPHFEGKRTYMHGAKKQLKYQYLRFKAMTKSFGYFNPSILDTLTGEYYRSIHKKKDYFYIYDYWAWEEEKVNSKLFELGWEQATDTTTTWRIGDGTTPFYNYLYYTIAGFSEHDTFRSNQIREGVMKRDEALRLVANENKPRYQNIKWYLDAISLDYEEVIKKVNSIKPLN